MILTSLPAPFSDSDWIFEVKFDGLRSLCYLTKGNVRLVSRRGHTYKSFRNLCEHIPSDVRATDAILDGEIVCLDDRGYSQFNTLMYRRPSSCVSRLCSAFNADIAGASLSINSPRFHFVPCDPAASPPAVHGV
jgi:ATP-dependent DNA ligase